MMIRSNLMSREDLYSDARISSLLSHHQPEPSFSKMWRSLYSFFCHQMCNSPGLWLPRCCRLQHPSTAINSLLLLQQNCGFGLCSIFTLVLYASVLTSFYILLPSSCSSVSAIFRHLPLSCWHHCKFSPIKGITSELCQCIKTLGLFFLLLPPSFSRHVQSDLLSSVDVCWPSKFFSIKWHCKVINVLIPLCGHSFLSVSAIWEGEHDLRRGMAETCPSSWCARCACCVAALPQRKKILCLRYFICCVLYYWMLWYYQSAVRVITSYHLEIVQKF